MPNPLAIGILGGLWLFGTAGDAYYTPSQIAGGTWNESVTPALPTVLTAT